LSLCPRCASAPMIWHLPSLTWFLLRRDPSGGEEQRAGIIKSATFWMLCRSESGARRENPLSDSLCGEPKGMRAIEDAFVLCYQKIIQRPRRSSRPTGSGWLPSTVSQGALGSSSDDQCGRVSFMLFDYEQMQRGGLRKYKMLLR